MRGESSSRSRGDHDGGYETSSTIGEDMMEAIGPALPLGEVMMEAMGPAPPLGEVMMEAMGPAPPFGGGGGGGDMMEAMGPAPPLGEAMMEAIGPALPLGEVMMEAMGPAPPLGEAMSHKFTLLLYLMNGLGTGNMLHPLIILLRLTLPQSSY